MVFVVHPRTRARLERFGLNATPGHARLRSVDPLGYLDFLKLMSEAQIVLTDSGGIQEETTILGVNCLTLRRNTERPITVEQGTNRLVEPDEASILAGWEASRERTGPPAAPPELWDGQASHRIARILLESA